MLLVNFILNFIFLFFLVNNLVVDDADKISVGYICLWEGKSTGEKFLCLFNLCYHMVVRTSVSTEQDVLLKTPLFRT